MTEKEKWKAGHGYVILVCNPSVNEAGARGRPPAEDQPRLQSETVSKRGR